MKSKQQARQTQVLIIVLSVMNGFQKEVRDRTLSVIAHAELIDSQGDRLLMRLKQ